MKRPDHVGPAACLPSGVKLSLSLPHLLRSVRDVVEDLVHGMAVERLLEPLLVEVVSHEADRATEDEQGCRYHH